MFFSVVNCFRDDSIFKYGLRFRNIQVNGKKFRACIDVASAVNLFGWNMNYPVKINDIMRDKYLNNDVRLLEELSIITKDVWTSVPGNGVSSFKAIQDAIKYFSLDTVDVLEGELCSGNRFGFYSLFADTTLEGNLNPINDKLKNLVMPNGESINFFDAPGAPFSNNPYEINGVRSKAFAGFHDGWRGGLFEHSYKVFMHLIDLLESSCYCNSRFNDLVNHNSCGNKSLNNKNCSTSPSSGLVDFGEYFCKHLYCFDENVFKNNFPLFYNSYDAGLSFYCSVNDRSMLAFALCFAICHDLCKVLNYDRVTDIKGDIAFIPSSLYKEHGTLSVLIAELNGIPDMFGISGELKTFLYDCICYHMDVFSPKYLLSSKAIELGCSLSDLPKEISKQINDECIQGLNKMKKDSKLGRFFHFCLLSDKMAADDIFIVSDLEYKNKPFSMV